MFKNLQSLQILISKSRKVTFFMILKMNFFRNSDSFSTFQNNFISLPRFIFSPNLFNLQNSYMFTNRQTSQILISRSQKVFLISSIKFSRSNFLQFFFYYLILIFSIFNQNIRILTLFIYSLNIISHPEMSDTDTYIHK